MRSPTLASNPNYNSNTTKPTLGILKHPFFIRLLHWEYWSATVVYAPIIFYWLWLCLKARSMYFFSASNPSIEYGGLTMESKFDIYNLIPQQFQPQTILVLPDTSQANIIATVENAGFTFPVYAKPDIGGKGIAVKKMDTPSALVSYLQLFNIKMLVQATIPYKEEAGIFYYRYPGDLKGHISGMVMKEYLKVTGNGKNTIYELLQQNERYILQIPALKQILGVAILEVLKAGEEKILVPVGNHARGSKFIDATGLVTEALQKSIDHICQQIPGFYFGRMDIKFNSILDLEQGKNWSIIELNGAGSEPTHMYDPRHSIFFAWQEIIRHWKILYKVSSLNHKLGVSYMGYSAGRKMFKDEKEYFKLVNAILAKEMAS